MDGYHYTLKINLDYRCNNSDGDMHCKNPVITIENFVIQNPPSRGDKLFLEGMADGGRLKLGEIVDVNHTCNVKKKENSSVLKLKRFFCTEEDFNNFYKDLETFKQGA